MKLIFETCDPRPEVLKGELKDDIFAARLMDVVLGTAEDVYGKAGAFFENTYATQGLRDLSAEVFGRLTGKQPANNSVVRLETSFGGGKTPQPDRSLPHREGAGHATDGLRGLLPAELLPVSPSRTSWGSWAPIWKRARASSTRRAGS